MKTKHTAGPWSHGEQFQPKHALQHAIGIGDGAGCIAQVNAVWPEAEANARLIAAAPALLEALQRLFNCVPLSVEGPHDDAKIVTSCKYWRKAYDQARAAIAAATGEGQ